jgi:hypothetical protein
MAVQRSNNFLNQMRIDVPHLRSIESAVRSDFDSLFTGLILGEDKSYTVRGLAIEMAGSIGASAAGLQLIVADSSVLHGKSNEAGTFFNIASGTANQVLSATTNTKVSGAFTPSALNYVSIEFTRQVDDATSSQVFLWNPTTKNEITKNLPLAETLDYQIVISSSIFTSNVLPIAIVTTDASNNVLTVEDRREMLFGTSTAGSVTPNPFNEYAWTDGRIPNFYQSSNSSVSPFEGGDKQIQNFKENDLAVKTEIKLMKGTSYWQSPNIGGSLAGLRYDLANTILTGQGSISHDAGNAGQINWDQDMFMSVLSTRIKYKLESNAATTDTDLADKEVAYIKIIRNVDIVPQLIFTNGSAVITSVGAISWTTGLEAGDYVKVGSEEDIAYYEILSVDSTSQVTLTINFGGTSTGVNGTDAKYAWGNYRTDAAPSTDRHIKIASLEAMPFDADTFWLFFRDDNAGVSRIYVRFLNAELKQGETITVADQVPADVLAYMGASSDADPDPNYATLATDAKTGTENYNSTQGENLTVRASKLTSMMADKAQDKTIQLLGTGFDTAVNTTNAANQELTFTSLSAGTPALNFIMTGSANNGTANITGTITLAANQVAYIDVDRNATFAVVPTVANITAVTLDENTYVVATRFNGTDVHLWDGTVIGADSSVSFGSHLDLISRQNRNLKMVAGGTWSWNSGTGDLSFTADAYIQIPGLADVRNTIQQSVQSPINLSAGDVAYVSINRATGAGANLTVSTSAIASLVLTDDIIVIARRIGAIVLVGSSSFSLINGESKELDAGASVETRSFTGQTNAADAAPTYSSSIRGTAAESLEARSGALTLSMGDGQEDRSAYFRSDDPVTWTGTQIEFTANIVLEIINTVTGTLTAHTILAAGSPVALADGESAYIAIDRTAASENVSVVKSGTVAIPAQTESDKDVFIFGRRKDTAGAVAYLHLPLHKQVLNTGQSVQLGASGGGDGGVTADTYFFRNADNEIDLTKWTTGTNATLSNANFATPGAIVGTYVKETVNHLSGDESYALKSTTANDFVVSEVITLQKRSQEKTNVVKCEFTYGGADDDIQPFMWDVTNDVLLSTSLDLIKANANSTTFTMQAHVNSTVDDIRIGFHVLVTNTSDLVFDDLSVSDNPFVFKDLFDSQYIHQHTSNGLGSTDNKIGRMTTTAVNSGALLIDIADTAAEGTTYTAVRDCTVIVAISHNANAASRFGLSLNSNQLTTAIETITAGHRIALTHAQNGTNGTQSTSAAIKMAKDDVLRRHSDGTADGTAARSSITITAVAGTEHIISAAKSNMSNPVDYTPTITGFGTPTGVNFEWSRLGKFLIVDGKLTVGTSTAVEAQITLPSGLTIALPHSTTQVIGNGARSTTSAEYDLVLGTDGDTFVNFGRQDASGGGLSAVNGNTWSSGDLSFHFMVPIAEWSSDVTLLAGIPVQKVAYVKDVKTTTTQGGTFTSSAPRTRDLNDVSGDSEIVSVSSNQFTLGAGKYAIEWSAPGNNVGNHQSHLRNTTDSTNDIIGSVIVMNGGEINTISSFGYGTITITSSKTFEIHHECSITGTTTGFGGAGSFGTGEVYTQVKITKLI